MRCETVYYNTHTTDDNNLELYNQEDDLPYSNANKTLEGMGTRIERKQEDSLAVFILLGTLRAAGIALQDFVLV